MRRSSCRRAAAAGLSVLGVAAAMTTIGTGTASADVPWDGALCQAAEKIRFYTADGAQSYEVRAHEHIRVVDAYDTYWAYGHGEGHSDRYFVWQHSTGADRIYNCHNT